MAEERGRQFTSMDQVPSRIERKVARHVTNTRGSTFVIYGLPPELTGGILARYSRAPSGMRVTFVREFLDENGDPSQEKGSELMDRVLNAFGDDSVGELENVHVGIEDVSQLLTKEIEDRRIGGSPIEQSTRYVIYDRKMPNGEWRYIRPDEIMESGLGGRFETATDKSFETYAEVVRRLTDYFERKFPRSDFKIDVLIDGEKVKIGEDQLRGDIERRNFNNSYRFAIRGAACDVGRCVLPASTLTHLGVNGNGRFFTHLISHLKSHDLAEMRERARQLEAELNRVIPTFIKRNAVYENLRETRRKMYGLAGELFHGISPEDEAVSFVPGEDFEYLDLVVASSLFPFTNISLPQILGEVGKMPEEKKAEILDAYSGKRKSRRDRTGRGLEAGYPLNFDLVGCFAEYRDLERHRMLTQQRQRITTDLGFYMPPEIVEIGMDSQVEEVATMMRDLNTDLRHVGLEEAAQYATLFDNRMRWYFGMNLREAQHLFELRTQPAGHHGYRKMCMEMADRVAQRYPWARKFYGLTDYSDSDNRIARAAEQGRIAGKNIASGADSETDL